MGLRGKGDDAALEAEVDRLAALPLTELAAEILPYVPTIKLRSLGSQGPDVYEVAKAMAPAKLKGPSTLRMAELIAEGLQVLEHAGLVRLGIRGDESNALEFRLTRAGEAALADGAITDRLPAPNA